MSDSLTGRTQNVSDRRSSGNRRAAVHSPVYADHASTSPLAPEAREAMLPLLQQNLGNPSSLHFEGMAVRKVVEQARSEIASLLHATSEEIFFTSGGTESDNWAIKGLAESRGSIGRHGIVSAIEHDAVLKTCAHLADNGLLSGYSSAADYQYGPWGEIREAEGIAADWNPFRFSSEYYDDETGLVYYNYRYYSPALGRWLSRDPIGEEGGMNLYAMIKNNTINHYDITGLLDLDKTPFYVGFRKLEEKDLLDRIANMIAFTHVDILEEKGGKYEFLRFGFGANKNLSTELLELKEYKFIQLYISKSGIIRWGSAKKKKCECTTIDDIRACILNAPNPLSKDSIVFGTNCHSDIEYVLAGCCLFGFNSLNLFSTPYDYEGDEEKILHCFKQKIWQIPYVNMSAYDIYITCKREVMNGSYD